MSNKKMKVIMLIFIALVFLGILFLSKYSGTTDKDNVNITDGGITPAMPYPAYNSSEPIPLSLAIRDYKTITALDPVKDLGAGKYKIGDLVIDTTDDKPDIALAYGGARLRTSTEWASEKCDGNRCVLSGSVKRTSLRYDEYFYVDKKGINSGEFQERVGKIAPTGPEYTRWSPVRITADPKGYLNYSLIGEEIKPGLFAIHGRYREIRGNVTMEQATIGHPELDGKSDLPERYAGLIIPSGDMINYFKCDESGHNCQ